MKTVEKTVDVNMTLYVLYEVQLRDRNGITCDLGQKFRTYKEALDYVKKQTVKGLMYHYAIDQFIYPASLKDERALKVEDCTDPYIFRQTVYPEFDIERYGEESKTHKERLLLVAELLGIDNSENIFITLT